MPGPPPITITADEVVRNLLRLLNLALTDLDDEVFRLLQERMPPALAAVTPVRTGRLKNGWFMTKGPAANTFQVRNHMFYVNFYGSRRLRAQNQARLRKVQTAVFQQAVFDAVTILFERAFPDA